MAGWAAILAEHPDLAPAVSLRDVYSAAQRFTEAIEAGRLSETEAESRLCILAHGLASRSRALRLLGNGVHPLAAAYAIRSLLAAHGVGGVDMATAGGD